MYLLGQLAVKTQFWLNVTLLKVSVIDMNYIDPIMDVVYYHNHGQIIVY